jgi:hypothetical protein
LRCTGIPRLSDDAEDAFAKTGKSGSIPQLLPVRKEAMAALTRLVRLKLKLVRLKTEN